MSKRHNGEGSMYPHGDGWAAYFWITTPSGMSKRKYLYGKDPDKLRDRWIRARAEVAKGPMVEEVPTVAQYSAYWLDEVIRPNKAPKTASKYETLTRLFVVPGLGAERMDRLKAKHVQTWLNKLRRTCQCCVQGKDAARPERKRRCCSKRQCCKAFPSSSSVATIRNCLRSMLRHAHDTEDYMTGNAAVPVEIATVETDVDQSWSTDEARRFLQSARDDDDLLYEAYVLVLALGLRKGELLGLTWESVDDEVGQIMIRHQLQRVDGQLLHRGVKTKASKAPLPLPDICVKALQRRWQRQCDDEWEAGRMSKRLWQNSLDLVFTTRYGTPIEPRNFSRSWEARCGKAGVRAVSVHTARRTCASLLADLGVHPRVAMRILRHAKFSMTMEVYTEVSDEATLTALKELGDSLG